MRSLISISKRSRLHLTRNLRRHGSHTPTPPLNRAYPPTPLPAIPTPTPHSFPPPTRTHAPLPTSFHPLLRADRPPPFTPSHDGELICLGLGVGVAGYSVACIKRSSGPSLPLPRSSPLPFPAFLPSSLALSLLLSLLPVLLLLTLPCSLDSI